MEKIIKEILKKGQCPDCNKKADKCDCVFKELYVTIKINGLRKALRGMIEIKENGK